MNLQHMQYRYEVLQKLVPPAVCIGDIVSAYHVKDENDIYDVHIITVSVDSSRWILWRPRSMLLLRR